MKYKVYIHTFPNNKKYVGLTTKEDVKRRWENGYGYKTQKLMYRAILKYGWKNIKHTVYQCETESEMKYLEKYLIAYYQSNNRKYGYNITAGGDGALGIPSARRRAVNQYNKQGVLIKTWESAYSVEKELNYDSATICKCANKGMPKAYGFYWFYSNEQPDFKTYKTQRKVYQYDLEGNFIAEFKNALEAGKSIGKPNSNICSCCNKKYKSAYGYIWKYEC